MESLEELHSSVKDSVLDPFPVITEVESYRDFWKPDRVTTLLLAESHVHTSADDFGHMWKYKNLGGHFVRFVYCLGYGENDLFEEPPINNDQGTRPYWEIFESCVHEVKSNEDFESLRKSSTKWEDRVKGKMELLETLRKHEVWLVDASPVAINRLNSETRIQLMREAWNVYTGDLVKRLVDDGLNAICIIGKTVGKAIGDDVKRLGLPVKVIP